VKRAVLLLFVWIIASSGCKRDAENTGSGVYPLAPDFALTSLDGKSLRLSGFRGKVVLLDFWATWCVPCKTQIPKFIELQNKLASSGLQVVGLSIDDDADVVHKFYREMKMNYPVALADARLAREYGGVLGLPIAFIINREGYIVTRHQGETSSEMLERELTRVLQRY
jgi:thiol-disulfide isomerase/thioredoxin